MLIFILFMTLILGAGLFYYANKIDIMQPSKERVYMDEDFRKTEVLPDRYPKFNPCVYSIDVFVPFVDLHQENYWLPDSTKQYGKWFRYYFWLHIVFGWVSCSLLVSALTGLIRKD